MFGITPMPIFDPRQEISYLSDFMVFFKPGDIVQFRPIDRAAYDEHVARVETGRFEPTPGPLCSWCPYRHECPEGRFEHERRHGIAA